MHTKKQEASRIIGIKRKGILPSVFPFSARYQTSAHQAPAERLGRPPETVATPDTVVA